MDMMGMGMAQPPAAAPMQQPAPMGAAPEEEEGESNVSPEEQAMYDQYINNAMEIIYPRGEEASVSPQILGPLKGEWPPELQEMMAGLEQPLSGEPLDNIAATAAVLTMMLEGSAASAGQPMPDEVIFHGGAEIVEELVDLGEELGLFELGDEEVEQGFYRAVDIYRQLSPRMDDAAKQALAGEFEQVMAADKEGRLGEIIPGMQAA
jgi:hypothetical protein